ncbi:hypothetical protein AACT_1066 [Arcobacter acticola]|uniref:Uncharacterized protein n=1 Tax=Arcobacter acticola TaxID=1849015 RepID=A0A6M8EFQ5_9BACT|nr:hypothetical protein [Arcobacter acticola]QKE28256.1 hypothetical protein AACT_1066 [Arcobacter acticola]
MSKIKNKIDKEIKKVEESVMSDFKNKTNHIDTNKVQFSFTTQLDNKVFEFFNLNTKFFSTL